MECLFALTAQQCTEALGCISPLCGPLNWTPTGPGCS
ncbi:hypothetical protein E2C01_098930 [Portunus trituberculatus]|uniref:Uncharacterized protein n=1 Tax=Portunus trituberculatus TaxID=210409 RepID=A0A5B7K887_PORTR|nr:hypothetical protein [Portunus trituberculatus]